MAKAPSGLFPATTETWAALGNLSGAELGHAIALSLGLEPINNSHRTLSQLHPEYVDRLNLAVADFDAGLKGFYRKRDPNEPPHRWVVPMAGFVQWALGKGLTLPAGFPGYTPPPKAPRQATRPRAAASPDYLREKDLLPLLPFGHATLWRKVGDGEFPAPVKLSARITAWKREDVEAWKKAHELPPAEEKKAAV